MGVKLMYIFALPNTVYKSSYVLRYVAVHWMYQKYSYQEFLQCTM